MFPKTSAYMYELNVPYIVVPTTIMTECKLSAKNARFCLKTLMISVNLNLFYPSYSTTSYELSLRSSVTAY